MNIVQRWMNFDSMCKKSGPSTNTDTRLRRAGLFAAVQGWLPSSTPLPRVLACENIAALTKLGEVTLMIIRISIKAMRAVPWAARAIPAQYIQSKSNRHTI
jgi:hypothetical protein